MREEFVQTYRQPISSLVCDNFNMHLLKIFEVFPLRTASM